MKSEVKKLMGALFLLAIFGLCEFLVYYVYRTVCTPLSIFNFMWCIMPVFALLEVGGLIAPSFITICWICVAIISFNVSAFLFGASRKSHTMTILKKDSLVNWRSVEYRRGIIIFFNLLAIAYTMLYIGKSINILKNGGLAELRYQYLNTSQLGNIMSTKEALIYQWLCIPIYTVDALLFVLNIIAKKKDIMLTVFAIVGVVLRTLMSAERTGIFELVSFFIIAYILYPNKKKIKLSMSQKIAIIILSISLIYITSIRKIGDATLLENIIIYFAGPISYLNHIILNPSKFGIGKEYLLGQASLGFLINIVYIIIWFVFKFEYNGSEAIISSYTRYYLPITENESGNHMYTMMYPFLLDYGFIGIILGMAVMGIVASKLYLKANKKNNNPTRWLLCCIYVSYTLFYSLFEYRFVYPATFFIVLFVFIFSSKPKNARRTYE